MPTQPLKLEYFTRMSAVVVFSFNYAYINQLSDQRNDGFNPQLLQSTCQSVKILNTTLLLMLYPQYESVVSMVIALDEQVEPAR